MSTWTTFDRLAMIQELLKCTTSFISYWWRDTIYGFRNSIIDNLTMQNNCDNIHLISFIFAVDFLWIRVKRWCNCAAETTTWYRRFHRHFWGSDVIDIFVRIHPSGTAEQWKNMSFSFPDGAIYPYIYKNKSWLTLLCCYLLQFGRYRTCYRFQITRKSNSTNITCLHEVKHTRQWTLSAQDSVQKYCRLFVVYSKYTTTSCKIRVELSK